MSAGAYLMVKFSDRAKLIPAVEQISQSDNVVKWDAVDGHYNLVLKVKELTNDFINEVRSLEGFSELSTCDLTADNDPSTGYDDQFSYSYLLIETADATSQAVADSLTSNNQISFCSPAEGNYSLVCMAQGETFDKIDRMINNDIKPLDDVLRFKQERVILLDRM